MDKRIKINEEYHKYHKNRLAQIKNFKLIYFDNYFQEHFVKKYMWDLPRASFELFGVDLTYQQVDIWEEYVKSGGWQGGKLVVPSGHGCFDKNHKVLMYDGSIKRVIDIKVGDEVMGDDGTKRIVLQLRSGKEDMYEFEFNSGDKHIYNASHKLVLIHKELNSIQEVEVKHYLKWQEHKKKQYVPYKKSKDNINKIKRLYIKHISYKGKGNYYGFTLNGNHRFLSADFIVTRNSGKTKFIGIISALHLLLFYKSITRIQAPTIKQVTTSSFKEITASLEMLKENRKINGKFYNSGWGFLLDLIQINKTNIYIKGFDTSWYIEAKTAPKGESTNLSGQHQLNYLLIFDEASGIKDEHIEASLGALSEEFNSCIMFSQHTRLAGKFHEFATIKSVSNGGVWNVLRLSSRYSPRVSPNQLKMWLETYTEDEIRVRIDGLPPKKDTGMLLSPDEIMKMYDIENNIYKEKVFSKPMKQIIFSYDIGYTGYRDSSILVIAEVEKIIEKTTNKERLYIKIIDIQKYNGTNGRLPTDFVKEIVFKEILQFLDEKASVGKFYENVYVGGDATAGGYEAFTILEDLLLETNSYNFITKGIQWGTEKLYFEDKKRFINGRAKAFVNLRDTITNDRIIITTNKYQALVQKELSNIPFKFTDTFKYKILSKEEMKKLNINSPDIADTIAQIFLMNIIPNESKVIDQNQEKEEIPSTDDLIALDFEDEELEVRNNRTTDNSVDILKPTTLNLDDEF